jgi:hypothetical protein
MNSNFLDTENHNNFLDTENFKYLIKFVFNDIKQKTNQDISNNKQYITIFKRLVQTIHERNMNKRVSKEYLNNLVIDKCVPFIIKQLNKENNNNSRFLKQNPLLISERPIQGQSQRQSQRQPSIQGHQTKNDFSQLTLSNQDTPSNIVNNISGISSRNGEKIDYTNRMKEFQEDRNYNDNGQPNPNQVKSINELIGKNTNDDEKIDFMKKMQELQNERNYTSQNNSMNDFQKSNNIENIRNNEQLQDSNNQNVEIDNTFLQQLYDNNANANNDNNDSNIDINSLTKLSSNYLEDDMGGAGVDVAYENVNNLKMNIIDKSEQNKLPEYDSNIENLKEEYKSENLASTIKNAEKELYQSTKKYNRTPAHLLVLEEDFTTGDSVSFSTKLIEPLVIDKPCDVFLEFINLQNIVEKDGTHLEEVNCFALQIDEFNIKTSSNNTNLRDKYIIPNDSFGTTDSGAEGATTTDATSYNIKLKSNYMCTINPIELSTINIKLYGIKAGTATELLESLNNGKFIIGLFLKKHK